MNNNKNIEKYNSILRESDKKNIPFVCFKY